MCGRAVAVELLHKKCAKIGWGYVRWEFYTHMIVHLKNHPKSTLLESPHNLSREASQLSGHTPRNSQAPFPIIALATNTLEKTDATCTRCEY